MTTDMTSDTSSELTSGPADLSWSPASHPLDPLTAQEISDAVAILRSGGALEPNVQFVMVTLQEPVKPAGLVFDPASPPDRVAKLVTYSKVEHLIYEVLVSLTTSAVLSVTPVPGKFPSVMMEDMFAVEALVQSDPQWQEAMRKRGVSDFSLAMVDPWPSGFTGPGDDPRTGPRLCRPLTFMRSAPGEHGYARPVEGLIVTVDMDAMTVVDVADHGVVPLPAHPGNYDGARMFDPQNRPAFTQFRDDVKPIEITQPEGPSFTVDGWGVTWQKWSLRVGFTPREGLVLHQINYVDRGRPRPVIYRAGLSEMVVPYGDAAPTHWNKNVFDQGEVGMGLMANSLTLGCDCLGYIHYFDAQVNTTSGEPLEIPNAICMHEEDQGIAWKHTDFRTGDVEVRRLRRLVISTIATVGNYEYGFFWYLYTDGTIEYEVKLTGVLTTGALPDGERPRHGQVVAPGLYGPNHQHFFNVRLDMTIDGERNSVYELDSVPDDAEHNPHNNAWVVRSTLLETEGTAMRKTNSATARYWQIANPAVTNELGNPVAYKLMPGASVPPMVQPAAGDYPYQSPEAEGLPKYVADDASVVDTDVVVWYTVGAHHIVRPEDWPVMPVNFAGFHLKPVGFFDGNPALDLPRSASAACHHHSAAGHGAQA
jgi:primary-amine oxidase